jgi:hypothetical protein
VIGAKFRTAHLAAMTNRRQTPLFVALSLILTIATVGSARIRFKHSETFIFATGGVERRFAGNRAGVLQNINSRLRLKVVPNADSAMALAQFDRKYPDPAILRTDAEVPSRARAIAILEHDALLLISPELRKSNRSRCREGLRRHAGHDDDVVVVKAAQSAE